MSDSCNNEELDFLIASCSIQRFTTKESLDLIKSKGYTISERTFFNCKNRMKENIGKRARSTIENLFPNYLERIDTLKVIRKEFWENYRNTKDVHLRIKILNSIRENEMYIYNFVEEVPSAIDKQKAAFSNLPIGNKLDSKIYLEERKARIKKLIETRDEPWPDPSLVPMDRRPSKSEHEKDLKELESDDEIDRRELK